MIRGVSAATGETVVESFGRNSEVARRETDGKCHINCMQVSTDQSALTVGASVTARHYDLNRPELVRQCLEGHSANITALGFEATTGDKWLFTASEDRSLKIWDFRASGFQMSVTTPAPILCATIHPNGGEIVAGSLAGRVINWDLASNRVRIDRVSATDATHVTALTFTDRLIACTLGGSIYVNDSVRSANSGSLEAESVIPYSPSQIGEHVDWIETPRLHDNFILSCSPASQDGILTASADGSVSVSVIRGDRKIQNLWRRQVSDSWLWAAREFRGERKIATCGSDGMVTVWDLETGSMNFQVAGDSRPLTSLALVEL